MSRPRQDSSSSGSDDLSALPFAAPLSRTSFLQPSFSPATYLSTLSNRHQTLEDLRSELRARSQWLSKELLDLVNSNYQDFLNLGNSLHGGEEKVEQVRVGLLGFRKEVGELKRVVELREQEVKLALEQRRYVRTKIDLARRLVDFAERLNECEAELVIELHQGQRIVLGEDEDEWEDSEDDEDDESEDEGGFGMSMVRLKRNVMLYRLLRETEKQFAEHPFVVAQGARMAKVKSTLLMDLSSALQQAKHAGVSASGRLLQVMKVYADMEESAAAVKAFKSLKAP